VSSDQEIRLNAVLDWLEKGHITTTQAAARIDPENRQVMCVARKFRRQRAYDARHPAADSRLIRRRRPSSTRCASRRRTSSSAPMAWPRSH
jgi:hypothetical protein